MQPPAAPGRRPSTLNEDADTAASSRPAFWVWLSRVWTDWRLALVIVKPETVVAWHRKASRAFWAWKIRKGKIGRPAVTNEVRDLIRRMSNAQAQPERLRRQLTMPVEPRNRPTQRAAAATVREAVSERTGHFGSICAGAQLTRKL